MKKLGVGIIGCGSISATYLKFGNIFKSLKVRAVADINMEAAEARASDFGVKALTVDEMLASEEIDVIVNLTIPEAHFDLTQRIVLAGKHAYSEKPFVLSLEEGKILRDLAQENGVCIGSAPDTFLGGSHQQARDLIDRGEIGRIIGGSCHVMSRGMEHWHPNPDFFFQPGAGPVLDLGPYYITNLVQLLGPVKAVAAMANASFATRRIANGPRNGEEIPVDTPTNIHALLEFENGAIVTLSSSWDVYQNSHPNMELYGTDGTMQLPDPNFFGGSLAIAQKDGPFETVPTTDHPFGMPNEEHGDGQMQANYRAAGLADMVEAIAEERKYRCNLDLALHVVDVMTSILKAGDTRAWVSMSTTCDRPEPISSEVARGLIG